jgi:hypothetical protein
LGAQAAPQTVHFSTREVISGISERFASSSSFWSITRSPATGSSGNGSAEAGFRCPVGFLFIPENYSSMSAKPVYAARSKRIMYAGSRAAEHREHFWPGFTFADFPVATTIPSTVCVQMGQ